MPRSDDDRDEDDEPIRKSRRRREADDLGDDEERPRRKRKEPEFEATDVLIPTNVSGYSIAACYVGLVGCFLPVLGLLFAIVAIVCGVIALRQRKKRKKSASYGAVTGDIRAICGIVFGGLTLLAHALFILIPVIGAAMK